MLAFRLASIHLILKPSVILHDISGRILNDLRQSPLRPSARCGTARAVTEPTVTGANLVLNRLSPTSPLAGGRIALDLGSATKVVQRLGERVGLAAPAFAEGMIRTAVARIVSAIEEISIANGHDLRDVSRPAVESPAPCAAPLSQPSWT